MVVFGGSMVAALNSRVCGAAPIATHRAQHAQLQACKRARGQPRDDSSNRRSRGTVHMHVLSIQMLATIFTAHARVRHCDGQIHGSIRAYTLQLAARCRARRPCGACEWPDAWGISPAARHRHIAMCRCISRAIAQCDAAACLASWPSLAHLQY